MLHSFLYNITFFVNYYSFVYIPNLLFFYFFMKMTSYTYKIIDLNNFSCNSNAGQLLSKSKSKQNQPSSIVWLQRTCFESVITVKVILLSTKKCDFTRWAKCEYWRLLGRGSAEDVIEWVMTMGRNIIQLLRQNLTVAIMPNNVQAGYEPEE